MQLPLVCFRSCPTSAAPLIFKGVLKSITSQRRVWEGWVVRDGLWSPDTKSGPGVPSLSFFLWTGEPDHRIQVLGPLHLALIIQQPDIFFCPIEGSTNSFLCSCMRKNVPSAQRFPQSPSTDGNFRSVLAFGESCGVTMLLT